MKTDCAGCGKATGIPADVLDDGEIAWHMGCLPDPAEIEKARKAHDKKRSAEQLASLKALASRQRNRDRGVTTKDIKRMRGRDDDPPAAEAKQ